MRSGLLFLAVLAACSSKPTGTGTGTGTNHATGACEAQRGKVEQLYRAEAQVKEPSRVDEAVADNTAMVMSDCARAPDKVAACLAKASTLADIESRCVVPLDDEGTEGEAMRR